MTMIRPARREEIPQAVDAWRAASAGHEVRGHAERLVGWAAEAGASLLIAPGAGQVAGMVLCLPGRAGDAKNPAGYCPDHGTGVSCPVGLIRADG
jgi:hypothetical protein